MIISASRRTDIPAYYGETFYNDLISGKFLIVNPFNNKKKELFFTKSDIDGIVFWTKNPLPFFKIIKKIKEHGYRFYFQYTLNNYPKTIEPLKYSLYERIEHLKELHQIIYPEKIILRYDPIIFTKDFNINFHIDNFENILENTSHYIEKIVISFVTIYRKIRKFFIEKIIEDKEIQFKLLENMSKIAKKYNKILEICCYPEDVSPLDISKAKCIDASIFGLKENKHKGQRKLCNCDKSIDVGFYHTCKTGCLYCYAK